MGASRGEKSQSLVPIHASTASRQWSAWSCGRATQTWSRATRAGDAAVSAKDVNENAEGGPVLKKDKSPVEARTVADADVVKKGDNFVLKADDKIRVTSKAVKMSKSRGNVVNPDDIVEQYGADAMRLYEMFMGPLEAVKPWQTEQISGVVREI